MPKDNSSCANEMNLKKNHSKMQSGNLFKQMSSMRDIMPLHGKPLHRLLVNCKKIKRKTNKLKEIKFQINIWVKGCRCKDRHVCYRRNGTTRTIEELTQDIKVIIRDMRGHRIDPPPRDLFTYSCSITSAWSFVCQCC